MHTLTAIRTATMQEQMIMSDKPHTARRELSEAQCAALAWLFWAGILLLYLLLQIVWCVIL